MNPKEAKKILPKDEYETFESILMNQISQTPSSKLKQRATLARRLRDKYKDLSHQQVAQTRSRRTNEIETDLYDRRSRIFQEVIDHLEEVLSEARPIDTQKRRSSPVRSRRERTISEAHRRQQQDQKLIHQARRRDRDLSE